MVNIDFEALVGGTIKVRAEQRDLIREHFEHAHNVKTYGLKSNRAWLQLYQALFASILKETQDKKATGKSKTDTKSRALEKAASVLRSIVEHTYEMIDRKTVDAITTHILDMCRRKRVMDSSIGLDYAKTLNVLLSYSPHLYHLDTVEWAQIVSLSFAVLLGDKLGAPSPLDEDYEGEEAHAPVSDGDAMDVDEEQPAAGPSRAGGAVTPRKRARQATPSSVVKKRPRARPQHTPISAEQIEYASVLRKLFSSPKSPLLDKQCERIDVLQRAVCSRCTRYFLTFPGECSAHIEILFALNSALVMLELNAKDLEMDFGLDLFPELLHLWGTSWATRTPGVKEQLVIATRTLFPFLSHPDVSDKRASDGFWRLWRLLEGEFDRIGMEPLVMESLRLEFISPGNVVPRMGESAFVKGTWRAGYGLTATQVLTWAGLELQADCLAKIHAEYEVEFLPQDHEPDAKRMRREDPIKAFLSSFEITASPAEQTRAQRLQFLLFFIDRHWPLVHHELQVEIHQRLCQLHNSDPSPLVHTWSSLCLAAVLMQGSLQSADWMSVWSMNLRRIPSDATCRAACHLAHAILVRKVIDSQRILSELENFAAELAVQGPTFPYDSVCAFLCEILRIARQDVRLFRMHLEDKILTWLQRTWRVADGTTRGFNALSKVEPHSWVDVLSLFHAICQLNRGVELESDVVLPDCYMTMRLLEERRTHIMRDLLLYAKLPTPRSVAQSGPQDPSSPNTLKAKPPPPISALDSPGRSIRFEELALPEGRERICSTFLQGSLDVLISEWQSSKDMRSSATAEKMRRTMDLFALTVAWEASLTLNGIRFTRKVMQTAAKLLDILTSMITLKKWSNADRALFLMGIAPLMLSRGNEDQGSRDALVKPGPNSGIRRSLALRLERSRAYEEERALATRTELQKTVWQMSDIQDACRGLLSALRTVCLYRFDPSVEEPVNDGADEDDKWKFVDKASQASTFVGEPRLATVAAVDLCVNALIRIPQLRSSTNDATRDKPLVEVITEGITSRFHLIGRSLLRGVRRRELHFTLANAEEGLEVFEKAYKVYLHRNSESFWLCAVEYLQSTLDLCLAKDSDAAKRFVAFASVAITECRYATRSIAEAIICFLDLYVKKDPSQTMWYMPDTLPPDELQSYSRHEDFRVRFEVSKSIGRLFNTLDKKVDLDKFYTTVRDGLPGDHQCCEEMVTRMITLGNIMVSSSEIRRSPYWLLVETCIHSPQYSDHIEAILQVVVAQIGIPTLADLFRAYAGQLAYTIWNTHKNWNKDDRPERFDVTRMPKLFGFKDRRAFAKDCFSLLGPVFVANQGEFSADGGFCFRALCHAKGQAVSDGMKECIAGIFALCIPFFVDGKLPLNDLAAVASDKQSQDLISVLLRHAAHCQLDVVDVGELLRSHLDTIIVTILRLLLDTDFSKDSAIYLLFEGLNELLENTGGTSCRILNGDRASSTLRLLTKATEGDVNMHRPVLPAVSSLTILRSLLWLDSQCNDVFTQETVYHVLTQLLASVSRAAVLNEQIRCLRAIMLLISLAGPCFKDPSVLWVLLRGCSVLLGQADLALTIRNILNWGFQAIRGNPGKVEGAESFLPDILARLGRTVDHYLANANDSMRDLGKHLQTWIQEIAADFYRVESLKQLVKSSVALWPRGVASGAALSSLQLTADDLDSVLQNDAVTSSKFSLIRSIAELATPEEVEFGKFSQTGFWLLKASLRSISRIDVLDCNAFSDYLFLHKGHVQAVEYEPSAGRSVASRHCAAYLKHKKPGSRLTPLPFIIRGLVDILSGDSVDEAYTAYLSLRSLVHLAADNHAQLKAVPKDVLGEVRLLRSYPIPTSMTEGRTIEELQNAGFTELAQDHPKWVCGFTTFLARVHAQEDASFGDIIRVLETNVAFAEQMLPVITHTLLESQTSHEKPLGSSYRRSLSAYFTELLSLNDTALHCIRAIVEVVLHLRHFDPPYARKDPLSYNKWLDVDFRLLSHSAVLSGAYASSLLFLEIANEMRQSVQVDVDMSPQGPHHGFSAEVEDTLYSIYSHIDEPDGFYAIKSGDVRRSVIRSAQHEGRWAQAFGFYGADNEAHLSHTLAPSSESSSGMVQALQSFGFDRLAMSFLQLSGSSSSTVADMEYELGWRTATWDLPAPEHGRRRGTALYSSLRAVHRERRQDQVDSVGRTAICSSMTQLGDASNEDFARIGEICQTLLCLREVQKWQTREIQRQIRIRSLDATLWTEFAKMPEDMDFPLAESLYATRLSLVRSAQQLDQRDQIGNMTSLFGRSLREVERHCLLNLSRSARSAGNLQVALNAVTQAQRLDTLVVANAATAEEFAHVLWLQGEKRRAIDCLGLLLEHEASQPAVREDVHGMRAQLGTWVAEARLGNAVTIGDEYFSPAADAVAAMLPDAKTQSIHATVFYRYALFAESQYDAISSTELARLELYIQRKQAELDFYKAEGLDAAENRMLAGSGTSSDKGIVTKYKNYRNVARKLLDRDRRNRDDLVQARAMFLRLAIQMFSQTLCHTHLHDDDAAIRLCSRWFSCFGDEGLNAEIAGYLEPIPSYKFIFLTRQLSARMQKVGVEEARSQQNLQGLMMRICRDHPFHSLYQVFALKSSKKVKSTDERTAASQAARVAAATSILDKMVHNANVSTRARDVEKLCMAYLLWASFPLKGDPAYHQKGTFAIPKGQKLLSIANMAVPVTTNTTPVDSTCEYRNMVTIARYEKEFEVAGGNARPKICTCIGSDGQPYKQLFKGEGGDDMRQDAVMSQVFGLVNRLLQRDRETRKRKLSLRAYNVIPLAAQAGLLEFVQDTSPLMLWLNSAHARYHPEDWGTDVCHMKLQKAAGPENKLATYNDICAHVRPVMRHFFTERYKVPAAWFAARLRYGRSVATTSIVGHILGLGDRHLSNILIDMQNGEVVHIDLGIAFDQGQVLPIPETVPFRLTRDIVDGLGTSGTDGVFQKCAEHTLRVLREESDVIKTVLEVFRHDPLHSWAASPAKIRNAQQGEITPASTINPPVPSNGAAVPSPVNSKHDNPTIFDNDYLDMNSGIADENADRALKSVLAKLDKSKSVEFIVNQLIREATDVANLSQIYYGWAAWL